MIDKTDLLTPKGSPAPESFLYDIKYYYGKNIPGEYPFDSGIYLANRRYCT